MSRAARVAELSVGRVEAAPAPKTSARRELGYFEQSRGPLASLVFVLPLVIVYELGTTGRAATEGFRGAPQHVIAFSLMQQFFGVFGATGRHLPAMAVAGILLAWHLARKDPWKLRWPTLASMAAEGIALCVPLIGLSVLLAHLFRGLPLAGAHAAGVHAAVGPHALPSREVLVLCLGAGIYEELVFRLILLTLLSLLVKDLLLFPAKATALFVVVVSAVLFSSYHYLGSESFHWNSISGWRTFAFRTLAGIYFGVLFLTRGFGVTAGTHAAYDILVLLVLP
jgi:membrane protease YdiL (CAAX protease family)